MTFDFPEKAAPTHISPCLTLIVSWSWKHFAVKLIVGIKNESSQDYSIATYNYE